MLFVFSLSADKIYLFNEYMFSEHYCVPATVFRLGQYFSPYWGDKQYTRKASINNLVDDLGGMKIRNRVCTVVGKINRKACILVTFPLQVFSHSWVKGEAYFGS